MLTALPVASAGCRSRAYGRLVSGQIVLIATTGLLWLAPPVRGVLLIVPVAPSTQGETLRWAREAGARLVAQGPYDGALVVFGDRDPLARAALRNGAMILRASGVGCGTADKDSV